MNREEMKTNYSIEVDYAVSTPLYNRIINRDTNEDQESIVVTEKPKTLIYCDPYADCQKRDVEEIKYGSGSNIKQADDVEIETNKEIESAAYGSSSPSFKTSVSSLEGEYIRPTMDDLMNE